MASTLGIDEAGRGCVLGPLVVGGFFVESDSDAALKAAGAADSKVLSPKRRLAAKKSLASLGEQHLYFIEPKDIDTGNLNRLEENAIVDLVVKCAPDRVIIDALGHPRTLPALVERLDQQASARGVHTQWLMEPKADHNYPVVGAASIFAKTERDQVIEDLKVKFGDFGSGYPSDPKTKAWLTQWFRTGQEWPHFVRTRWGTIRALEQPQLFS